MTKLFAALPWLAAGTYFLYQGKGIEAVLLCVIGVGMTEIRDEVRAIRSALTVPEPPPPKSADKYKRERRSTKLAEWVLPIVRPSGSIALSAALTALLFAALVYWRDLWVTPELSDMFDHQNALARMAILYGGGLAAFLVNLIVVGKITNPIFYALSPEFAEERDRKRRVRQLSVGDRVRIPPHRDPEATITYVDPSGDGFQLLWDDTGQEKFLWHHEIDEFEVVVPAS